MLLQCVSVVTGCLSLNEASFSGPCDVVHDDTTGFLFVCAPHPPFALSAALTPRSIRYVADTGNHALRVVCDGFNTVKTLAGSGSSGFCDG